MNSNNIVAHVQYSLFRKCLKTGWEIAPRSLADHELVLITGGKGQVAIENKVHPLKQGVLLYLSPELKHSLISCNDDPMSFYGIHFSYLIADFFNNQWKCEGRNEVLPIKAVSDAVAYQKLQVLFKKINLYWNEKPPGYEMICRSALLEVLCQCMCYSEVNYASRKKIETLLAYINKNLNRRIAVEEMAEIVNLSPDYLGVQFKSITGFTIVQYLNRSRIDQAKVLLLDENLRIRDIAEKLGFCDEFYFSKTFKKYEGISPLNYVKGMKQYLTYS